MENTTATRRQRVIEAIIETDRLIEKESRYRKDLQKAEYLASLESHKAKLVSMVGMALCPACGSMHEAADTLHAEYHHAS